ncbi:transcription factor IIIC subunit delta N-term-domain-containing protein [Phyllosticta capitalensis]
MHEAITLNVWPSTINCLSWSQDGNIAVAAGETVELLIPILQSDTEAIQSAQNWHNVHIKTNLFTETEVPTIDPLGFRAVSFGEELSTSDVIALAWSPPGLAKHSKCALVVLTSNLTLSLWASDSDFKNARSWKRLLIFNHSLERHWQKLDRDDEHTVGGLEWEVRRRTRRRIRSFAWSPRVRPQTALSQSVKDSQLPMSGFFLAVCNDANDVAILRVQSPFDFFSTTISRWSAHVVAQCSVGPRIKLELDPPFTLFDEHMDEQRHASNIAWSPWSLDDRDNAESLLAYTTNKSIHIRRVSMAAYSHNISISPEDVFVDDSVGTRTAHFVQWAPKMQNQAAQLVVFSQKGLFCYDILFKDQFRVNMSKHNLDDRWDMVTGCAFNKLSSRELEIQFVSQLPTFSTPTTALRIPIKDDHQSNPSPFLRSLAESKALFGAENELGDAVLTKAWGLCPSPMGDLVASAVSFHPSDMVEYTISAASRTEIGIHPFRDNQGAFSMPKHAGVCPIDDLSAETILFSAKSWLEENMEARAEESSARQTIMDQLAKTLGLDDSSAATPYAELVLSGRKNLSLQDERSLVQELRRHIYLDHDQIQRRYGRLLTHFFNPKQRNQHDDAPTILHLINQVLSMLKAHYVDSTTSQKIRSVYAEMRTWLADPETDNAQDAAATSEATYVEQCEICDENIKFESFDWARCSQGHEFVRCALTFLAIQAPGISKLCGICGKRFLSEQHVLELDTLLDEAANENDQSQALGVVLVANTLPRLELSDAGRANRYRSIPMMNYEPLRLSGSPAKSTKIVEGPSSPTKSICLDMDETSPIETDFLAGTGSARRTNFFDDSSSDELEKRESLSLSLNDPRKMTPKSNKSDNLSRKEANHLGASPDEYNHVRGSNGKMRADAERSPTPGTKIMSDLHRSSGVSSILVPSGAASKENLLDKTPQRPSRPGTGMETRGGSTGYDNNKFRISGVFEDGPSEELQTLDSKTDDRILGVHAITLQALLRDEEALQASASASTRCKSVSSDLAGLKTDPALTTSRADSAMLTGAVSSQQDSSPPQEKKKVLLIPPPIDTTGQPRTKHSKPKTPYPFYHRKGNALFRPSPLSAPDDQFSSETEIPSRQVILEIRLRRREGVYAPRVSRISIPSRTQLSRDQSQLNEKQPSTTPSSSSSSLTKRLKDGTSPSGPSHPFTTDASLADALRTEYAHLAGPWPIRFFSARTLSRMDVVVSSVAGAAAGGPEHIDMAGTELLRLVRRPKKGIKDSHWVNWCVRIGERVRAAAAGPAGRSFSAMRVGDAAAENGFSTNSLHNQRRWSTGTPRTPTPGGGFPVRVDGMGTRRTPPSRASSGVFAGGSSATWDAADHMEGRDRDTLRSNTNYRYSFLSPHSSTAVDATLSAAERGSGGPDESSPSPDDAASENQITALTVEFIESWSGVRIALALLLVLLLALAGIALWTVLGKGVMAEGWQGQGARVGTGVLVGGVVLMVGWTLVGAWVGASWCVV